MAKVSPSAELKHVTKVTQFSAGDIRNASELYTKHAEQLSSERMQELAPDWIESIEASVTRVLSDMQLTARDLYERGLNVFPIPYKSKKSYKLKPLFTSRLHHCSTLCRHAGKEDVTELFRRDNLAVMTGRTSGNLIAIDCDTPAAFDGVGEELTARNIPFWAITGRRGGAYLLRVIEGEAANTPKDKSKFPGVEIWGNRHLIVLPPSVHPSGILYQWATPEPRYHLQKGESIPAVSIRALDWLGVERAKIAQRWQEPETFNLGDWAAMLSYNNRETLAGIGVSEGNRNDKLFNALCDMKGNGIDYHEAEQIAREYAQRVRLEDCEAIDTLKSAYSKARTPARQSGTGQRVREWQRAQALAELFDWRGTFGKKAQTRRACYMACIERARLDGRLHWRATTREIAELANTDKKRAGEYLHDLAAAELIKPIGYKEGGIYRFLNLPRDCKPQDIDLPKTQGEQDVFSKLGLVSWQVWRYLLQNEVDNGAQIARETNLPSSSVYKALRILQNENIRLITRGGDGKLYGEPRTEASLQSMALFWNNGASPSQRRKETHRIEREINATRIIRNARARWMAENERVT